MESGNFNSMTTMPGWSSAGFLQERNLRSKFWCRFHSRPARAASETIFSPMRLVSSSAEDAGQLRGQTNFASLWRCRLPRHGLGKRYCSGHSRRWPYAVSLRYFGGLAGQMECDRSAGGGSADGPLYSQGQTALGGAARQHFLRANHRNLADGLDGARASVLFGKRADHTENRWLH